VIQAVMTAKKVAAMMGMERCIEPRHSSKACVIQLAPAGLSNLVHGLVQSQVFDKYHCKTPVIEMQRCRCILLSFAQHMALTCYCYMTNNNLGQQTGVLLVCFMLTCVNVVGRCRM